MNDFIPPAPSVPDSGRWKPVQRGFPLGAEVLTEVGWVDFRVFWSTNFLGKEVPFKGNGYGTPGFVPTVHEWGQWFVSDRFPRVATVDPVGGNVFFVKPEKFIYHNYKGRLAHVKMKGVDLLTTLFTDLWLKPKYGRVWKFVLADDVIRNNYSSFNYLLVNKFNVDMYGFFSPEKSLGDEVLLSMVGDYEPVVGLRSNLKAYIGSPIVVYPRKHVCRERVWNFYNYEVMGENGVKVLADRVRTEVECFNVVVPPYHNIIVRRGRRDDNPRTLWVGGPVVVGDGLDKSLLKVDNVKGVAAGVGSYSLLRPDYRVLSGEEMFKKL